MGIYTDYGRFAKARQFKDWCNSGAGIWFGFGMGSPEWDKIITDSEDQGLGRPNVPPSSPNLYSPLYRWFTSYKADQGATPPVTLAPQELSLIDRSYWGTTENVWPTNEVVKNNPDIPSLSSSPSLGFYNENSADPQFPPTEAVYCNYEEDTNQGYRLLFPQVPVFPQVYPTDWSDHIDTYESTSGFDPSVEPTDPAKYKDFAYNYHLYYSESHCLSGSGNLLYGAPLGFLAFIQGSAQFVEPVEDDSSTEAIDNIRKFKYGNHYWRIVQESSIRQSMGDMKLPHHILLTVSVFPNELARSSLVELELPVRQVSVFKFPDSLASTLGVDTTPIPRSNQVIRRDSLNMIYHKLNDTTIITRSPDSSTRKNIPFHVFTPLDPDDQQTQKPTIEMIINDFMTARKRDVQQTDRYGYIIGF
jgi:hypothetical protein